MNLIKRFSSAMIILSFCMLSACNLPASAVKAPVANQDQQIAAQTPDLSNALTLAVQTIQAATQQAQAGAPAPTATNTPSSGSSTPTVTVNSATNCRTGPGTAYDIVLTFQPGATAEVIGKYSPSNYWIIKTPTGGSCWLWGAYATVQGNSAALAEMVPPPAPVVDNSSDNSDSGSSSDSTPPTATFTPKPLSPGLVQNMLQVDPNLLHALAKPVAPSHLTVTTTCTYFPITHNLKTRTDHLSWSSVSNATGYYVYAGGSKVATTAGTSINIMATTTKGNITFGVVAYNANGTSKTTITTSHCP